MTDPLSFILRSRKNLPLPLRMGYGWFKRWINSHPIWDNEEFRCHYLWLQETERWSRDQLEALQLEQLQALVKHAYDNVPYYRQLFTDNFLTPADIASLDDLQKIPLTTKDDVRNKLEYLLPRNIDRSRLRYETTGGSTNTPLGLYHDAATVDFREYAFIYRQWRWAGYQRGDRTVEIRGGFVPRTSRNGKRVWWDYDADNNVLLLSAFDMTDANMHNYIEKIKAFSPQFINATPSSLHILVHFMRRNQINGIRPKAIFCESETLPLWLREIVEQYFRCKIFAGYGMTERVADAVECECHEGYHVSMEYGILELVDEDNTSINEPGKVGRVVGSGFDTYCMPLIRYALDDLASYATGECSCGRQSTLIQDFKGRIQEFIVLKSGQLVSIHAILAGHTPIWRKIRELRFIQEHEGSLTAEVVKIPSFTENNIRSNFTRDFYERLPENELDLCVTFVDSISRTTRGKLPLLEQRLPIKFGEPMFEITP